jgi:adenosylcobinamide-GDP ribazoletransferase
MTATDPTGGEHPRSFGDRLRDALAFLTPLARTTTPPSPETMACFPIVGAGIGLAEGIAWRGARQIWTPLTAAVVVVATDAAVTGALHLDGLADTADGLFAHVPAKSRLAIMAEPEVGTFGSIALLISVLGRAAALASMEPSPLLLAALSCASRSVMVLGSRALPYAREEGLATPFLQPVVGSDRASQAALAGLAGSAIVATVAHGRRGLFGVLAGVGAGGAVLIAARRRIGGFTGDVLGAAGQACETIGLVATARR